MSDLLLVDHMFLLCEPRNALNTFEHNSFTAGGKTLSVTVTKLFLCCGTTDNLTM